MATSDERENSSGRKNQTEEQRSAEFVDELRDRVPTTEQSARESAGFVRRPPDGRPSDIGVSDTDRVVPKDEEKGQQTYDISRRGEHHIQGDEVPTSGDHKERRNEETHL